MSLANAVVKTAPFTIDKSLLDDTFKEVTLSPNLMKQRIEKAIGVLRSSWKFKHFCGDSMIKELSHSVWAYLREERPTAMLSYALCAMLSFEC